MRKVREKVKEVEKLILRLLLNEVASPDEVDKFIRSVDCGLVSYSGTGYFVDIPYAFESVTERRVVTSIEVDGSKWSLTSSVPSNEHLFFIVFVSDDTEKGPNVMLECACIGSMSEEGRKELKSISLEPRRSIAGSNRD